MSLESQLRNLLDDSLQLSHDDRVELAVALMEGNIVSQRQAHEMTGLSRDTIRKYSKEKAMHKQ